MSATASIWRLEITTSRSTFTIIGYEDDLRPHLEAWGDGALGVGVLRIQGFTDSFDRAPKTIAIDKESVEGMEITGLYASTFDVLDTLRRPQRTAD